MHNIDKLREEIALLQAERKTLTTWRRTRAEVGREFDALVQHYAEQGAAHLGTEAARAGIGGPADPFAVYANGVRIDLGPLLVALLGAPAARKALAASLEQVPVGDERRTVAQIDAELDALETQEEALCVEHELDRRPDARPDVVIG